MTKNPDQMQINFDDVRTSGHSAIEHSPASEELDELLFSPSFSNLDPEIQDRVLDEYAEKLGSYHEASLATGIRIGLDCAAGIKPPVEIVETPASVSLEDRARHLSEALDNYSEKAKRLGRIKKLTGPTVREQDIDYDHIDRLDFNARKYSRLGKAALSKSAHDLRYAGFDEDEIHKKLSENADEFWDYFYNPDNNDKRPGENNSRRGKLRRKIKKYLKSSE